jgi:beta-glucosidase
VIGPDADDPQSMVGDWAGASSQGNWMTQRPAARDGATVLDGFRAVGPADWTITHHRGADIGQLILDPAGPVFPDGQPRHGLRGSRFCMGEPLPSG